MLILASNSPRRKQLLMLGGWEFAILAPHVNENVFPAEAPADYVRRLAEEKAWAGMRDRRHATPPYNQDVSFDCGREYSALRSVCLAAEHEQAGQAATKADKVRPNVADSLPYGEQAVILAADTAVVDPVEEDGDRSVQAAGEILGKPASPEEAVGMLRRLRGRVHQVFTGLAALRTADSRLLSEVVVTDVLMRDYSDDEIRTYVETGDPFDKAGAYAIQHPVFRPVQNLQGCYANVMGLPVCHASRLLAQLGCPPASDVTRECQETLAYACELYRLALRQDA
jgi:MAF protein